MLNIINFSSVSYVKNGRLILNNISFNIEKKSFVAIIGNNGSGKSTIVNILAGINSYDGYININGYFLDNKNIFDIRKNMSIVLPNINFISDNVIDQLVVRLENLGKERVYIKKRLDYITNLFNIKHLLNKKVYEINNSDKQIIMIASALITEPSILVLDDCIHQLSPNARTFVLKTLLKYKKENNLTIILSTKNSNDLLFADRVLVIDKGKIIMDNTPIKVFKEEKKSKKLGLNIPFVIDLSLELMSQKIISHIYTSMERLVDDIWK